MKRSTGSKLPFFKRQWVHLKSLSKVRSLQDLRIWLSNLEFNLIFVFLLITGWFASGTLLQEQESNKNTPAIALPRVQVMTLTAKKGFSNYTLQGFLEADQKVTLKAEIDGLVDSIKVQKGERLNRGDVLATLSLEARLSELKEAEALVAQRELEYENALKLEKKQFQTKIAAADFKSRLEAARANLNQIKEEISDTKIRAPFDGFVDKRFVSVGDFLRQGDDLFDFVAREPMLAVVNVSESVVRFLERGRRAEIRVRDKTYTGKVSFVSRIADADTRSFRVEVTLDQIDEGVVDGLAVSVTMPIREGLVHKVSPASLAVNSEGEPGLKILNENNIVEFYPIEIYAQDGSGITVVGLPETIRLITVGQNFVRVGDRAEPVEIELKTSKNEVAR